MGLPQIVLVTSTTRPNLFRHTYDRLTGHGGIARLFAAGRIAKPWVYYCKRIDERAPDFVDTSVWDLNLKMKGRPYINTFYEMLERADKDADFLFFEDDITPCKNAVERAIIESVPAWAGAMTFFDCRNEWPSPGIFPHPLERDLWGSQAMKFPARVMPAYKDFVTKRSIKLRDGTDLWAGLAAYRVGRTVAGYSPTIFQHIGVLSAYAPGRPPFEAKNFPGEDFDAMGDCSDPVIQGTWTAVTEDLYCPMHRKVHEPKDFARCNFKRTI